MLLLHEMLGIIHDPLVGLLCGVDFGGFTWILPKANFVRGYG